MKQFFKLILFCVVAIQATAQTPRGEELVGLHTVPTSELTNVSSPIIGSILYNPTDEKVYVYTASGWKTYTNSSTAVYSGSFIISGTGNVTITGLPFRPSNITFVAHPNVDTPNLDARSSNGSTNVDTKENVFGTMNGFAQVYNGTTTQQVIFAGGSGRSINDISRYASNSHCIGLRYANQNGGAYGRTTALLTTFNTNGFTLNVDEYEDTVLVMYTAYK